MLVTSLPGRWSLVVLALVGLAGCSAIVREGPPPLAPRHTLKELRDRAVVKQSLDYSCGMAALATLMSYYFGDTVAEQELLASLEPRFTKERWDLKLLRGFTLLDLKHTAEARGYRAAGFELTLEQLTRLRTPVIVHLQPFGYKHFAVLRGIDRGRVYLADPARGNLRMSLDRFTTEWTGVIFVLGKDGEEGITRYPLELPRPEHVAPERLRVLPIVELGDFARDAGVRIGPR